LAIIAVDLDSGQEGTRNFPVASKHLLGPVLTDGDLDEREAEAPEPHGDHGTAPVGLDVEVSNVSVGVTTTVTMAWTGGIGYDPQTAAHLQNLNHDLHRNERRPVGPTLGIVDPTWAG
jgi:hypothetical protein